MEPNEKEPVRENRFTWKREDIRIIKRSNDKPKNGKDKK